MKEELTTMLLSVTLEDKLWLKMTAAENQTTVAAMIREWIAEKRAEGGSQANGRKGV